MWGWGSRSEVEGRDWGMGDGERLERGFGSAFGQDLEKVWLWTPILAVRREAPNGIEFGN